jgi:microcin C transport system substrate-binding protein
VSLPPDPTLSRRDALALLAALGAGAPALAAAATAAAARPSGPAGAAGDFTPPATGRWVHAYAAYGAPKYGPDFSHFEYVNPDAPRGDTLKLRNPDRRTSFDKYNPFTTRGNAPAGVLIWMVEGLAHLAQDEPSTMYGAARREHVGGADYSAIELPHPPRGALLQRRPGDAGRRAAQFRHAVGERGRPTYQTLLSGIARVLAVDARTVRFEFAEKTRDPLFVAGTMPVFSRKWGEGKKFSEIVTEHPIASGPYVIDKVDMPRRIEFARNPDYWAAGLPVRRGHFNFDRVVYRNYTDQAVAREAFKAGEFDLLKEYGARSWVRQHKGVKWDDGRIVKARLRDRLRPVHAGLHAQHAAAAVPGHARARGAGLHLRLREHQQDRPLQARQQPVQQFRVRGRGPAGAGRAGVAGALWRRTAAARLRPPFVAPRTDADPLALRRNLLRARALLEEAGWALDEGGTLRNAKGEAFEFEYLSPREGGILDWQAQPEEAGHHAEGALVDFALYRTRLRSTTTT